MKSQLIILMLCIASIGNAQIQIIASDTEICNGDTVTLSVDNNLTTTFAAGNNHRGNMFDIVAIKDVVIDFFDVHPMANTTIEIYYKKFTFVGSENNSAAWTFVGSAAIIAQPQGTATPVPINVNVAISTGETYGFYVTSSNVAVSLNYSNGTNPGAAFAFDANLRFLEGVGLEYPFSGTPFSPRIWNGNIHYSVPSDNVLWTTGETTDVINVSPPITTTYSVSVNNLINVDNVTIINNSTFSNIAVGVCDTFMAPSGAIYTTSQILDDIIPNSAGCDSTITVDLTIQASDSSITVSICDTFYSPSGTAYTSNQIISDVIPNHLGCDSTITIDLTIYDKSSSSITVAVCDSFVAPSGAVYNTSQIVTDVIPNLIGCDSNITIDLTISTIADVDATVYTQNTPILTAKATGVSYQWIDCDNNNTAINGETNQSFTATSTSNYAVMVTKNGCVNTSSCINVTFVGIDGISNALNITAYPNPTTDVLQINMGNIKQATVNITDIKGKVIKHLISDKEIETISFSTYPIGIYFINVSNNGKTSTLRIVKQ